MVDTNTSQPASGAKPFATAGEAGAATRELIDRLLASDPEIAKIGEHLKITLSLYIQRRGEELLTKLMEAAQQQEKAQ